MNMSQYQTIDFEFITNSSGDFDSLLDRLDMKKEDAGVLALTYYGLYINGVYKGGRKIFMIDPTGKGAWELDDEQTPDHKRADAVTLEIDEDIIRNLTRHAHQPDPADTLTAAFILLEKICDVRDSGWGLGLYDEKAHDMIPITLEISTLEPSQESNDTLVRSLAPSKPNLH